jgi:hypothetical protein
MRLYELSSFEKWFAGSKVVDKNGNPLRMFHSTKNEFEEFAPGSHFGTAKAAKHRFYDKTVAEKGFEREIDNFRTYPVYLSIKNPLKVEDLMASDEATLFNYIKEQIFNKSFLGEDHRFKNFNLKYARTEGVYKALEKIGYDGLFYKNKIEDRGKHSWVIFRPDQVRFALNNMSESYNDEDDFKTAHPLSLEEVHHEYDDIDYNTQFKPLKKKDTFRVFHGFYSLSDAVHTAKHGLTGAEVADRRYSYESNNNPKGLFVSLKLDVAKEFARETIIEFVAREDELEPPVWPGNGYTVQGQMAQYFPHGAAGRAAKAARRKQSGKETEDLIRKNPDHMRHIMFSDDRYKAMMLFTGREYQALYMGHLNPARISAFWVSDQPERDGKYATWSRLSVQDFLEKFGDKEGKRSHERDLSGRVFAPEDVFDPEIFKERITQAIRRNDGNPDELMRDIYNFYLKDDSHGRKIDRFQQVMQHYLWPKQLGPALRWIMKNYSKPI